MFYLNFVSNENFPINGKPLSNDFTIPQNQWFNFDDDYILCDMLGQRMELKLV